MKKFQLLALFLMMSIITITHAQTSPISIRDIQGMGHESPYLNQPVSDVVGIVTALLNNGFWMQDPTPDDNLATSEGIFIFTNTFPSVNIGDAVSVSGVVRERYGQTQIGGENAGELPDGMFAIGGVSNPNNTPLSIREWACEGTCTIEPIIVGEGSDESKIACQSDISRQRPFDVIDDDSLTSYDPETDGIDFWESLEGMLVCMYNPISISPNRSYNEFWVVPDAGAGASPFNARGGLTITADDFNPESIHIDDTLFNGLDTQPDKEIYPVSVDVGAKIEGAITGIIGYGFGNYEFLVNVPFTLIPSPLTREVTELVGDGEKSFTFATYNVENLMGNADDSEFLSRAEQICNHLLAPDIVMLQEIQDDNGDLDTRTVSADETLTLLIVAIAETCDVVYDYAQIDPLRNQDGGQPGGNIRVAFLYRTDRPVSLYSTITGASDEAVTLTCYGGVVPNFSLGRIDPTNQAFNRGMVEDVEFFESRKPLFGYFIIADTPFFFINLHLNSKGGDDPLWGFSQPPVEITAIQRQAQIAVIKQFVQDILDCRPDANIIIGGDYNDFQFSDAVTEFINTVPELTVMNTTLPAEERYSYNYQGNAQALDHISVSVNIVMNYAPVYDTVHINSEFYEQVSDHDPSLIRITLP